MNYHLRFINKIGLSFLIIGLAPSLSLPALAIPQGQAVVSGQGISGQGTSLSDAQTDAQPGGIPTIAQFLPETLPNLSTAQVPNSMAQVTAVSQLSDVQPTDWAFQALQSLVERYSVIAGYPDGTFRGNRSLSRYEFAAVLNTSLDKD